MLRILLCVVLVIVKDAAEAGTVPPTTTIAMPPLPTAPTAAPAPAPAPAPVPLPLPLPMPPMPMPPMPNFMQPRPTMQVLPKANPFQNLMYMNLFNNDMMPMDKMFPLLLMNQFSGASGAGGGGGGAMMNPMMLMASQGSDMMRRLLMFNMASRGMTGGGSGMGMRGMMPFALMGGMGA